MSDKAIKITELQILGAMNAMCEESLSPETFEAWEKVCQALKATRPGLTSPVLEPTAAVVNEDSVVEPYPVEDRNAKLAFHKSVGLIKGKYKISKHDGSPIDEGAEYFVLRLDDGGSDPVHIRACRRAITYYAAEIYKHLPFLANDIFTKYGHEYQHHDWEVPPRTCITLVVPEPFEVGHVVVVPGFCKLQRIA